MRPEESAQKEGANTMEDEEKQTACGAEDNKDGKEEEN